MGMTTLARSTAPLASRSSLTPSISSAVISAIGGPRALRLRLAAGLTGDSKGSISTIDADLSRGTGAGRGIFLGTKLWLNGLGFGLARKDDAGGPAIERVMCDPFRDGVLCLGADRLLSARELGDSMTIGVDREAR